MSAFLFTTAAGKSTTMSAMVGLTAPTKGAEPLGRVKRPTRPAGPTQVFAKLTVFVVLLLKEEAEVVGGFSIWDPFYPVS